MNPPDPEVVVVVLVITTEWDMLKNYINHLTENHKRDAVAYIYVVAICN